MDITLPLKLDDNKDISTSETELESIKESLTNILLTNWGEKPFDFTFGANLRKFKRYPMNYDTFEMMKISIDFAIENYENRVIVNKIDISFNKLSGKLFIKVFIDFKGNQEELSVSVSMD